MYNRPDIDMVFAQHRKQDRDSDGVARNVGRVDQVRGCRVSSQRLDGGDEAF